MNLIPYGKHFIDDNDINAVIEVLKSDFITQGKKIEEFEQDIAKFHNCKYAAVFSSGTAALHGAYFASGIGKNDEFITSPITFVASANAGIYMGAKPVLCDIEMKTYNISIDYIQDKITKDTKVITPVSYAGNPVDIKKIREIIKDKDICIIHDAAHALGSRINGADICDYADMAVLSFHPVKHITSGEGGAVITNNKDLYEKLILFRNHGINRNKDKMINYYDGPWYYEMQDLGFNYRLTDMQCALGISQLKKAKQSIKKRNEIACIYNNELKNIGFIKTPENNFDISWLKENKSPENIHSYHLYPILLEKSINRLDFFNYLREKGIMVQIHYIPINYMPYYQKEFRFKKGDMPNAENFYSREISIPMYPTLKDEDLNYVIETIKKYQ